MLFSRYAALAVFGLLFVRWGLVAGDFSGDDVAMHVDDGHAGGVWALFSIRTLAFGALAFGASGLLGELADWSTPVTLGLAIGLGAGSWLGVGALFTYLRRTQSGGLLTDSSWIGSVAVLVVPFGPDGIGRISLTAGGQVTELPARRAAAHADMPAASFTRCSIDRLEEGVAIILPLSDLLSP